MAGTLKIYVGTYPTGEWVTILTGSGAAAGDTGQIQYNTAGGFDADSNFVWDKASQILTINGSIYGVAIAGIVGFGGDALLDSGGAGGAVSFEAGAGDGVGTGGNGELVAGDGGDTGNGGKAILRSGDGGATSGNGGDVEITAGIGTGGGSDGVVNISTGASGTFTTVDLKTVTVLHGIITSII